MVGPEVAAKYHGRDKSNDCEQEDDADEPHEKLLHAEVGGTECNGGVHEAEE